MSETLLPIGGFSNWPVNGAVAALCDVCDFPAQSGHQRYVPWQNVSSGDCWSKRACDWTIIQKAASWQIMIMDHLELNALYVLLKVMIYTTMLKCSEKTFEGVSILFDVNFKWVVSAILNTFWKVPFIIEGVSLPNTLHGRNPTNQLRFVVCTTPRHPNILWVGVWTPFHISWGSAFKGSKHPFTRYDWRILDV